MACRSLKLSKEEIANIWANHMISDFFQPLVNQTAEESIAKCDELRANVKVLDNAKYQLLGTEIKKRVSQVAKKQVGLGEPNVDPNNEIFRNGGTAAHDIMRELIDYHHTGKGDFVDLQKRALSRGDMKFEYKHLKELNDLARETVDAINELQKSVDPKGKVKILTEQFLADPVKNVGGTVDVLAIFSDNTGAIYDFKTTGRLGYDSGGRGITSEELFPYSATRAYDLSMAEYKRLAVERLGLKNIRQNRLLPIAVEYKLKPYEDRITGNDRLPEVQTLLASSSSSEFLKPIPTGGEASRWEGLNKLLEKQYKQINTLSKELKNATSEDERNNLRGRITNITRSIRKVLGEEDIHDLLQTISSLAKEAETRLSEPKSKGKSEENPAYLSTGELAQIRNEMNVYKDIMENTHQYMEDMKEKDPNIYDKLEKEIARIKPDYDRVLTDVTLAYGDRGLEELPIECKDENDNLRPTDELTFGELQFLKLSELEHPIFKATWKLFEESAHNMKQRMITMDEDVYGKTEALWKWASENGTSRQDAFKMLINEKTGNMYSRLGKDFVRKRDDALTNKTDEGVNFIKDNYELKDPEQWANDFKVRLETQKKIEFARHNKNQAIIDADGKIITSGKRMKEGYEKSMQSWINNNDLLHSDKAWINKHNLRYYTKIKDKALKENYSDEYKRIKSIKPLHDFYDMWHNYMEEFSKIFGITDYGRLPSNFIPNIRKEMMEHLTRDNFHIGAGMKELIDAFNVRDEDVYIASTDEFGIRREVPILFMNKFFDKDGNVDNTKKSYDLSSSLMTFGKMALNYERMLDLEPKVNALKTLLGEPSSEQGGIQSRDRFGRRIKGKIQPYLTKEGRATETYKLFEDITDAYLYGIRFKEQSLIPGVDTTHLLTKSKHFYTTLRLSFAIIPAGGAFVAGKIGSILTGSKDISYSNKQFGEASTDMITKAKEYKSMGDFFDPENDDYFERMSLKHKSSWLVRVARDRTGFSFLRNTDKNITRHIMKAMAKNYGITEEGNIIRLNKPARDTNNKLTTIGALHPEYKTIESKFTMDDKGKGSVTGLSKEGYIEFRAAIKNTADQIVGNMNPEDIGKADVALLQNQMMSFRSWIPALVREWTGKLRWNNEIQAMDYGRFRAMLSEYSDKNFTDQEIEDGRNMFMYMKHVLLPTTTRLITDLITFGLAPKIGEKMGVSANNAIFGNRVNPERAQRAFARWQLENPGLRDKVTFDDFLEIKHAQIKAGLMSLRFIIGMSAMAMYFAAKDPETDRPRYVDNLMTRDMYKIFTKAGSELTFMWNPTEFTNLLINPLPTLGIITQFKKTALNGIQETSNFLQGKPRSKQDKTPAGYYALQWVYGGPQLMRAFELFNTMQKSPYQIYQISSQMSY